MGFVEMYAQVRVMKPPGDTNANTMKKGVTGNG